MFLRRFNFRIWKTQPDQVLYSILWFLLKLLWEPFSLKRSHWWHWQKVNLGRDIKPLIVEGDKTSLDRNTAWRNFWQTNFGWQKVAVLEVANCVWCHEGQFYVPFQIGWGEVNGKSKKQLEICSIVHLEPILGLLLGPSDVNFFAFDLEGRPVELRLLKVITKKQTLKENIQIF